MAGLGVASGRVRVGAVAGLGVANGRVRVGAVARYATCPWCMTMILSASITVSSLLEREGG